MLETRIEYTDSPSDHPICMDRKMAMFADEGFCHQDPLKRCQAIRNWIVENICHGEKKRHRERYRTSQETFYDREGVCGEMTLLFLAFARHMKVPCNYVKVLQDECWNRVNHACAYAIIHGGDYFIGVADVRFNVWHQEMYPLSDDELMHEFYTSYRKAGPRSFNWLVRERNKFHKPPNPRKEYPSISIHQKVNKYMRDKYPQVYADLDRAYLEALRIRMRDIRDNE